MHKLRKLSLTKVWSSSKSKSRKDPRRKYAHKDEWKTYVSVWITYIVHVSRLMIVSYVEYAQIALSVTLSLEWCCSNFYFLYIFWKEVSRRMATACTQLQNWDIESQLQYGECMMKISNLYFVSERALSELTLPSIK